MSSKPRLQPMPIAAADLYNEIIRRQESIQDMVGVCLKEGVKLHNRPLMTALNELIRQRTIEIKDLCREISDMVPLDRAGRFPKWVTVTENILQLIPDILERTNRIDGAIRMTEWSYLEALFGRIGRTNREIGEALKSLPKKAKVNGDEVWREVINEIEFKD